MNPFFSVCVPVTNREKTIFDTLCSIALQSFRDFEVIITECGSNDRSREEIERFFKSDIFQNHPFVYIYKNFDYFPKTVEDWNESLRLANGKYIAMLEGDDKYTSNHLLDAHEVLCVQNNVGFYAVGNQCHARPYVGLYHSEEWLKMTVMMNDITPPSESIFIRLNNSGTPFFYNDQDYEYAPEMDLYLRLALSGYNVFFSDKCDVIRNISNKNFYASLWHYYADHFTLLNKYRNDIAPELYKKSMNNQISNVIQDSLHSGSFKIFFTTSCAVANKTTVFDYCRSLFKISSHFLLRKLHFIN